jgi:hypothetical protein
MQCNTLCLHPKTQKHMKKLLILAVAASATFASCKKKDDVKSCEATVAGIAGNYKITKIDIVVNGVASGTDVLSQYLETCEKDDIYQLAADKKVTYQDAGTACSPASSGSGAWDVVNGKLTITHNGSGFDIASGTVTNNCNNLVVDDSFGGATLRFTFTKQ